MTAGLRNRIDYIKSHYFFCRTLFRRLTAVSNQMPVSVSSVAFTFAALVVGYDHLAVQLRRSRRHHAFSHELLNRCPTFHR
ncbi:hypothetical protein BHM03_00018294 [Ensete ventricosum]|nr:hypothetical protein BHM03_00018294 [Ensete ventricosum]